MKFKILKIKSLVTVLSFFCIICIYAASNALAQNQPQTKSNDFSTVNWDDDSTEENMETDNLSNVDRDEAPSETAVESEDQSNIGWEDDGTDEQADDEEEDGLMTMNKEEIDHLESKERDIHIWGFFLVIAYMFGGILTAYFTRNRKLAVDSPPELLILLHSLWPLEWLLYPFFGKRVR